MFLYMSKNDRRVLQRIEIPGAQIRCRKPSVLSIIPSQTSPAPLLNLSKSGLSFTSEHDFTSGSSIQMNLLFPDGFKLELVGQIRWKKEVSGEGFQFGVQFRPFGHNKSYNSVHALEYLRSLRHQSQDFFFTGPDNQN